MYTRAHTETKFLQSNRYLFETLNDHYVQQRSQKLITNSLLFKDTILYFMYVMQ